MSVQSKPLLGSVTVLDGQLMPISSIKMCWYISEAEHSPQGDTICAILLRTSVSCTARDQRSIWASSLPLMLPKRESIGKNMGLIRAEHAHAGLCPLSPVTLLQLWHGGVTMDSVDSWRFPCPYYHPAMLFSMSLPAPHAPMKTVSTKLL